MLAVPPRSRVRSPSCSARSTADSTAAASACATEAVAQHAAPRSRTWPAGWRSPGPRCPAPSRGRARTGRAFALAQAGAGQHPERAGDDRRLVAEDVAEHVLGEDHVEVARRGDELHRGRVDERVLELDVRELLGVHAVDDLAPEPARLQDVGLVDARDLAIARPRTRCARSARSPRPLYSQRSVARVGGAGLLAEVDAAGQLAHDEQVGALDDLAAQRAGVEERRDRPAPGAGWRRGRAPCAGRAGPAPAAARRGRSCPTSARRRRRAGRRRRRGRRRASRPSARCRGRRSRRRRRGAPRISKSPTAPQQLDGGGGDLGPDAVAGQE